MSSSIKEAAQAAREAIKTGGVPGKMAEPQIGERASVPQAGAGQHEGERAAKPAGAKDDVSVTMLEDEEVADALESQGATAEGEEQSTEERQPPREGDAEQPEAGAEEETPDGAEEGGQPVEEREPVELPPVREGQQPLAVDIDDQETTERIRNLIKGNLRRERYQEVVQAVEQREEHLAQFEDALRVDPVSLIIERTNPQIQAELARYLYTLPHVRDALAETFGEGADDATLRAAGLELENRRLARRSETVTELNRRSDYRTRGREIRQGIQRMLPEDMDADTATLLAKDLERDVTEHILSNPRAANLRVEDLPTILGRRLALHGITAEEAVERLQDTGVAPLPPGTRSAARTNGAPARKPSQQPARTGKEVVAQANARRRAGAVPGGGAGIPAAGVVLPRKQGVKARLSSLRELFLGG